MNSKIRQDDRVIIDVAINGLRGREMNQNIPISPEEIAIETVKCLDAGASMVHAHNKDPGITGREAAEEYLRTWRSVLAQRPNTLWYPTLVGDDDPSHTGVEHVEILAQEVGLRIGCVDPGSVNLATHLVEGAPDGLVYATSLERIRKQFAVYRKLGLGAAIGIYEPGYLRTTIKFYHAGHIPEGSSINLYFIGEYGLLSTEPANTAGLPPRLSCLDLYLELMKGCGLPWFVSIWGAGDVDARPLYARALEMGGHIQVGLETHFNPAHKPTNVELLQEVIDMARAAGRPVATPKQAAELLGLS